ncbi:MULTISPECIES: hypothetical protein [Marinobacter]|uniref:hypothetical protein n=1 Tax=Marinobacter TaxID=2742 RepID=UPI000DAC571A|nr:MULTISPECIES: hypothetical protein [Marinobacter]
MSVTEEYKEVDRVLYGHILSFLGALTAFATAVVLLVVQGSVSAGRGFGLMGVIMLVLAIPFCFAAFVLNLKLLRRDRVHPKSIKAVDNFTTTAMSFGVVGFWGIIGAWTTLLGLVFTAAVFVAFGATVFVARRFDRLNPRDDE